jgi:hypothetical protein
MFLVIPYLGILIPAVLLTVPFYFFNKYLQHKIKPRENGKRLFLYFVVVIASIFIYITIGIYLIVVVTKFLTK